MTRLGMAALVSATLAACGAQDGAPQATATSLQIDVGQSVSKTMSEIANLANVASFTPTSLITTNGTYANCVFDPVSNTLSFTPKTANLETLTDLCNVTFQDATGKTLGPVNANLKNIDNKPPVIPTITPLDTTAGVAWTQVLPVATDGLTVDPSKITYAVERANGTLVPPPVVPVPVGTLYTFDPQTRTLAGTGSISTSEVLTFTATDTAGNEGTTNISNKLDHPGTASITGPATSSIGSTIQITLNATDVDGIASWSVTSQRVTTTGVKGIVRNHVSGAGTPPATANVLAGGGLGFTEEYTLTIIDNNGKTTISPLFITTIVI